jgi:hypothetical protein
MERKSLKDKKSVESKTTPKVEEAELILNVNQACLAFQLTGTTRTHVLKKYAGVDHTESEWSRIFYNERITS